MRRRLTRVHFACGSPGRGRRAARGCRSVCGRLARVPRRRAARRVERNRHPRPVSRRRAESPVARAGESGLFRACRRGRTRLRDRLRFRRAGPRGTERILCFDEKTGKLLWKQEWDASYGPFVNTNGPHATPTVDGDRVYALGTAGTLLAMNAVTGEVLWRKDFVKDFRAELADLRIQQRAHRRRRSPDRVHQPHAGCQGLRLRQDDRQGDLAGARHRRGDR